MTSFKQYLKLIRESREEEENLLLEDRIDYLKTALKDKISFDHDPAAKIKDSDALIDHIATKVDPTPAKLHTQWVAHQYKQGNIAQEDFPKVKKALKGFELVKKNLEVKDLNKFNSLADLEDHVATQKGRSEADAKEKLVTKSTPAENLEPLYSSEHGSGFKVPSRATSIKLYGPGGTLAKTNWCTAANSNSNMFSHYEGGKYTFHTPENAVLQIHHKSGQIMDERNTPINLNTNPRFSPHKEAIKEFINKTADLEGIKESSLQIKTGSDITPEKIKEESDNLTSQFTSGRSYVNSRDIDKLATHPFEHNVFAHAMDWTKVHGGKLEDHYSDINSIHSKIASNPSAPPHILDELHETHKNKPSGMVLHNLAGNLSVQGPTREALKDIPAFASRTDLSEDEVSHIIKHGTDTHRENLYENVHVPMTEEHQKAAYDKEDKTKEWDYNKTPLIHHLLSRPDLHSTVADAAIADKAKGVNSNINLAKSASVDTINKHYKNIEPSHIYARESHEGISDEVMSHVLSSSLNPSTIRPEHADKAIELSKYSPEQVLNIKGASKQHYDNAAISSMKDSDYSSSPISAYKHPKVSSPIKETLAGHIASKYSYHNPDKQSLMQSFSISHITKGISEGSTLAKKTLAGAKNIQKSHFDELIKEPANHGAIVNSKSAPPSILSQLADSPSDYIRSKVKSHKNTPADVASKIQFDESNT